MQIQGATGGAVQTSLLEAMGSTPAAAIFAGALVGPAQIGARSAPIQLAALRVADDLRALALLCQSVLHGPSKSSGIGD